MVVSLPFCICINPPANTVKQGGESTQKPDALRLSDPCQRGGVTPHCQRSQYDPVTDYVLLRKPAGTTPCRRHIRRQSVVQAMLTTRPAGTLTSSPGHRAKHPNHLKHRGKVAPTAPNASALLDRALINRFNPSPALAGVRARRTPPTRLQGGCSV